MLVCCIFNLSNNFSLQVLQIFILFGFTTNLMACAWVYTAITEGELRCVAAAERVGGAGH